MIDFLLAKRFISRAAILAAIAAQLPITGIARASSGPEPLASTVPAALPGDETLTCSQILTEAQSRGREFDALSKEAERLKVPMSARTAGLLAAHQATAAAAGLVPGADAVGGIAVGVSANAYMESSRADEKAARKPLEQRLEFAMARSDYLNGLHLKKCTSSSAPGGAASQQGTELSAHCLSLKDESQRLRKEIQTDMADISSMSRDGMRKGMAASRAVGMASRIAGMIAPGIGGIIGGGISTAMSAAQRAQMQAVTDKAHSMVERQAGMAQRISDVETEYLESCGSLPDQAADAGE
jgi:hypothetical protein